MYYVYVLRSLKDQKKYYGFTADLDTRLKSHNKGRVKSTAKRRPFVIVYFELVETEEEAISKERYFKSGFGRKYVNNKIKALSSNG